MYSPAKRPRNSSRGVACNQGGPVPPTSSSGQQRSGSSNDSSFGRNSMMNPHRPYYNNKIGNQQGHRATFHPNNGADYHRGGGPSQHNQPGQSSSDVEAQRLEARRMREAQNVKKKTFDVPPKFVVTKKLDSVDLAIQDVFGDYSTFAGSKSTSTDMIGVEQAPPTPAPVVQHDDQDLLFAPHNLMSNSSRPKGSNSIPFNVGNNNNNNNNSRPAIPPWGSRDVPRPHSSNSNNGNSNSSSKPQAGDHRSSRNKLRPEQLTAARARAAAHNASVSGSGHTGTFTFPSTTPSPSVDDILKTTAFQEEILTPLKKNSHEISRNSPNPNGDALREEIRMPMCDLLSPIKDHRSPLLPTPTLLAPAPHLPPPPNQHTNPHHKSGWSRPHNMSPQYQSRLPVRPRRRAGSYQGIGRGHHPPLAWLPPLARAHHSPPTQFALEKCSPPNSLVNNNNRNCSKYNNDRATNNNTEKVNANAAVYHKTRRLGRSPCVIRNSTSPQPTIDTDSISLPDIIDSIAQAVNKTSESFKIPHGYDDMDCDLSEASEEEEGEIGDKPEASTNEVDSHISDHSQPLPAISQTGHETVDQVKKDLAFSDDESTTSSDTESTSTEGEVADTNDVAFDESATTKIDSEQSKVNWSLTTLWSQDDHQTNNETKNSHGNNQHHSNSSRARSSLTTRSTTPTLSETSEDEAPTPRPTPQIIALPRPAEKKSVSRCSSDAEMQLEPPKKSTKRNVSSKSKKEKPILKQKTVGRGRPPKRSVTSKYQLPESKVKSKAFILTSDDDSDPEIPTTNSSEVSTRRSLSNRKKSPRSSTTTTTTTNITTTTPIQQSENKKYFTNQSITSRKVHKEVNEPKSKGKSNSTSSCGRFSFVQYLNQAETSKLNNSQDTDQNKKQLLNRLYRGKGSKGADNQERIADKEKGANASAKIVGKGKGNPERDTDGNLKLKKDNTDAAIESLKRPKEDSSPSRSTKKRKKSKSPDLSSKKSNRGRKRKVDSLASEIIETKYNSDVNNKKSKDQNKFTHQSDAMSGRSSSRCSVEASSHLSNSPHSQYGDNCDRVPVSGESAAAYQTRQVLSTTGSAELSSKSHKYSSINSIVPSDDTTHESRSTTNSHQTNPRNGTRVVASHHPESYLPSISNSTERDTLPVNIPYPIREKFPIMAELQGLDLENIFMTLFVGNRVDNVANDHMVYMDRAKKLKRDADGMDSDRTYQGTKYIEAVLFFILSGKAMETDSAVTQSAVTMYSDTIALIQWVSSVFKRTSHNIKYPNQLECNAKLAVLCLLCQCILSLKVYSMRQYEIRESKLICCDYFNKRTKEKHLSSGTTPHHHSSNITTNSNNNAGHRPASSPSALSPTPSPAGSVNSDSSHSSGYNTSTERRAAQGNPRSATPSPSQPTQAPGQASVPAKMEIPVELHEHLMRYYDVTRHLNGAEDWWKEAQDLIKEHHLEDFFSCLDHVVLPLTKQSNTLQLVCYIMAGLREIDEIIARSKRAAHEDRRVATGSSYDH